MLETHSLEQLDDMLGSEFAVIDDQNLQVFYVQVSHLQVIQGHEIKAGIERCFQLSNCKGLGQDCQNTSLPHRLKIVRMTLAGHQHEWNISKLGIAADRRNKFRPTHVLKVHRTKNEIRSRRSEEHTSELQSRGHLVCRLLLEKKKDFFRALLLIPSWSAVRRP